VRYDTQAAFTTLSSWSAFDTATVSPAARGFFGGAFDGRYVYFVPHWDGGADGLVTRYDTQAPFVAGSSWSMFDVGADAVAVRFDAKAPRSLPPGYAHGSFLVAMCERLGFSTWEGRALCRAPAQTCSEPTTLSP